MSEVRQGVRDVATADARAFLQRRVVSVSDGLWAQGEGHSFYIWIFDTLTAYANRDDDE